MKSAPLWRLKFARFCFSRISHMTVSTRLAEARKLQAASLRPLQGHTLCQVMGWIHCIVIYDKLYYKPILTLVLGFVC